MAAALGGQLALAARDQASARRSAIIAVTAVGILLLNGRGSTSFQDGTFVYAAITTFSITIADILALAPRRAWIVGMLDTAIIGGVMLLATRQAPYLPRGMTDREIAQTPR